MEQGAQEAKAGGPWWPWPRPSARPLQPGPLYPPPKKSMGQLRGIRIPPGLNTHNTMLKRPWSQSGQIRPRPAGETITGWLDHSTAGAGGLEGASAGCGPSEPRTASFLSPRTAN